MTLATQIVTIVSLGLAVVVAIVGFMIFLSRKMGELRQAEWEIPFKIRVMDVNNKMGFNRATGCTPDETITLNRVIAALQDHKVLVTLRQEAPGIYQSASEVKGQYDNYMFWGRVRRLGLTPKSLDGL